LYYFLTKKNEWKKELVGDDVDDSDNDEYDISLDDIEQKEPKRADMAYLLAYKHFGNSKVVPVAMQELNITITVYNVGELEAINVALDDTEDWSNSSFFKVVGSAKATFKSIPVGGSVSHSFIVLPLTHGQHNSGAAHLTYRQVGGSSNEVETSQSSVLGVFPIESLVKWRLRQAPFAMEWGIFLLLSCVATSLASLMSSSAQDALIVKDQEASKKKN
jgi:hypothetical protein